LDDLFRLWRYRGVRLDLRRRWSDLCQRDLPMERFRLNRRLQLRKEKQRDADRKDMKKHGSDPAVRLVS
jgi:hypothetical protein